MNEKRIAMIAATKIRQQRRREEVAYLFFMEGYSIDEIAEYSVYTSKTIERDVKYIQSHLEEFLN